MNYNVDYFLNKFREIPEENWCVNTYQADEDTFCAFGHCGARVSDTGRDITTSESHALLDLIQRNLRDFVAGINDGDSPDYQQATPKERILAALMDIKKLESVEISDPPVTIEDLIGEEILA